MDTSGQPDLTQALGGLWVRFLPEIEARVAILEDAATAFADNRLSIEEQQAANAAAHKLAGVLGTFGLTRGTDLARELEDAYSSQESPDPAFAARLAALAAQLRAVVEAHK